MAKRPLFPKATQHQSQGFVLMESVLVAAIAMMIVLPTLAEMFSKQIDISRRARDTDLLEASVGKDINAIRQFARYWRLRSGPYSSSFITSAVTGISPYRSSRTSQMYDPAVRAECTSKNSFLLNFLADLKNYSFANIEIVNSPRLFNTDYDITPTSISSRYKLTRRVERLINDPSIPTLRLSYKLEPLNDAPPLALERTAELQLEMQNGC